MLSPASYHETNSVEDSIRSFLMAQVRRFVATTRGIRGVRRIALIGSLATAKAAPKDADLLITVDDEVDLIPLAVAGRQLKGRAQSRNSGADIFLSDTKGAYLGRICHYRDCRPGVRTRCRARHCGRRPHLCDDLDVLRLPVELVEAPTLELWPVVVRRAPIPGDVEELLSDGVRLWRIIGEPLGPTDGHTYPTD